jgi:phospholipid-binding lipoprotein MlaA
VRTSRRLPDLALARVVLALALVVLATACVSAPGTNDPFEGANRNVFAFNEGVDQNVLQPVARSYDKVAPDGFQTLLSNFYANLRFPTIFANNLFQGDPKAAAVTTGRFLANTFIGFFGFFDTATAWGLPRQEQDFGLTLGHWGVGPGPFLMLPLLGPSSARDLTGVVVDLPLSAPTWMLSFWVTGPARILQIVNARAAFLETVDENRAAAFDYYVFTRDAFLSYREGRLRTGDASATPQATEADKDLYFPDDEADR